jgi:hypothetical protein
MKMRKRSRFSLADVRVGIFLFAKLVETRARCYYIFMRFIPGGYYGKHSKVEGSFECGLPSFIHK